MLLVAEPQLGWGRSPVPPPPPPAGNPTSCTPCPSTEPRAWCRAQHPPLRPPQHREVLSREDLPCPGQIPRGFGEGGGEGKPSYCLKIPSARRQPQSPKPPPCPSGSPRRRGGGRRGTGVSQQSCPFDLSRISRQLTFIWGSARPRHHRHPPQQPPSPACTRCPSPERPGPSLPGVGAGAPDATPLGSATPLKSEGRRVLTLVPKNAHQLGQELPHCAVPHNRPRRPQRTEPRAGARPLT